MCAIIGIIITRNHLPLRISGLYAQQHRGQEGAGIVAAHEGKLKRHMGEGLVSEVFSDSTIFKNYLAIPQSGILGTLRQEYLI